MPIIPRSDQSRHCNVPFGEDFELAEKWLRVGLNGYEN